MLHLHVQLLMFSSGYHEMKVEALAPLPQLKLKMKLFNLDLCNCAGPDCAKIFRHTQPFRRIGWAAPPFQLPAEPNVVVAPPL